MYMYMYVCIYIYEYIICMYVYIYIYIYIYTHSVENPLGGRRLVWRRLIFGSPEGGFGRPRERTEPTNLRVLGFRGSGLRVSHGGFRVLGLGFRTFRAQFALVTGKQLNTHK